MKRPCTALLFLLFNCYAVTALSQDSSLVDLKKVENYLQGINNKTEDFTDRVDKYTRKALEKVLKQERKMQAKLMKADSLLAKKIFKYSIDSLLKLKQLIGRTGSPGRLNDASYIPYLDTLKQSLSFLNQAGQLSAFSSFFEKNGLSAINKVKEVEERIAMVGNIRAFLKDRKNVLNDYLKKFPDLSKYIRRINKEAFYYTEQINEYKSALSDPSKAEKLIVDALTKVPAFQKFMQENSQLAQLFSFTGFASGPPAGNIPVVNGIPPRYAVQQSIQSGFGGAAANANQLFAQQMQQFGNMPTKLKNRLNELGGMDNREMPDFKPNNQRAKSFWKRVEYGMDMQFGKATNFLPANSNIALQAGYKLNDKSSIGIGAAYKLGLGTGWNNIRFTHEGLGLRSYVNWKIKKTFYLQGGSEWNYNAAFVNIDQLKDQSAWQHSALLGITKKYQFSKKWKGNVQVLFDFLYKQHNPHSQPVLFRFGYGL